MYIPKPFLNTNQDDIVAFIQRFSFATIITNKDGVPIATHLPFIIQKRNEKLFLLAHFAVANPQAEDIANQKVLVIFNEPHAYISPKFYEKEQTVPTWNYLAVHAYGKATLITEDTEKLNLLEQTIVSFEEDYLKQWQGLADDYKLKMLKGIVGFEIEVTDIQAKKKLSQNKTLNERENIINAFRSSNNANENQIAEYMVQLNQEG